VGEGRRFDTPAVSFGASRSSCSTRRFRESVACADRIQGVCQVPEPLGGGTGGPPPAGDLVVTRAGGDVSGVAWGLRCGFALVLGSL